MILWCRYILLVLTALFSVITMTAQDFPVLPTDPAVKTGTLPNGTTYYIVSNSALKGFADFALVQMTGKANLPDSSSLRTVDIARESLASSSRCLSSTVQDFFTSHGAFPDKSGFVKVSDNATEYHFRDILLTEKSTLDSALLALMDIVDKVSRTDDDFVRKWYAPADQAIVVSGDMDAADVEYKLKVLSMMTPSRDSHSRLEYLWQPVDSAKYIKVQGKADGLATVTATWRSSRPSKQIMNTVQPVIYEMFLVQLGKLAKEGISQELRSLNVPVADIGTTYMVGNQSGGDESFTVYVTVEDDCLDKAVTALSSVMSRINAGQTETMDLLRVKRVCMDALQELINEPIRNNSEYIDRCVASFLYNSSLATLKSKRDFLASRHVEPARELRLFNAISAALLDSEKNLHVAYSGNASPDSVKCLFDAAWNHPQPVQTSPRPSVIDIPRHIPTEKKMKVKSARADYMSGSTVWTFSNGFTVIYKRMDTGGRMYYNLALNEGFSSIRDLEKGEGGYISDQFFLSKIGQMTASDFLDCLNAEGLSMDAHVGLTYMMLSGSTPDDKLELMINAMLAALYKRTPDTEAFDYYASGESLALTNRKGSREDRTVAIDSIICKDYNYSSHKSLSTISSDIQEKAERYFLSQSQKTNDGILVLLGNVNETELKKLLLKYADCFKTTDKAFRRPSVRYQPVSGASTYTTEGDENIVDIAMSTPVTLTTDNFMAAEIAAMILEKHISQAVVNTGMCLTVRHDCRIYPQERLSMRVTLNEASPDGFHPDITPLSSTEAVALVRAVLSEIEGLEISSGELSLLKEQLKGAIALEMKGPMYWMNTITRRYLAGKDFTTNYAVKVDAVTAEKVKNILVALSKGSKVEYIISKK